MVECGINVLSLLLTVSVGNVFWSRSVLPYEGEDACDIYIDEKHFTMVMDFLHYTMNEGR